MTVTLEEIREVVEKAKIQISGGLCYATKEAKHQQLKDTEFTLNCIGMMLDKLITQIEDQEGK